MHPKNFRHKEVVITGGSSGIGLAVALRFAGLGAHLHLIARGHQRLEQAKNKIITQHNDVRIEIHSCDVNNPQEVESTITGLGNRTGIDILINNAGQMLCGRFEDQALDAMQKTFSTNYWGCVYATKAALPYLKQTGNGHIAFVSSVAGYTGLFGYAHYAPSKFALSGLAECLRMELKDHGIGVTVIYPPDTQTPLLEYEQAHTLDECRALSKNARVLEAESVARKLVEGIRKDRFEVLCNGESRLIKFMKGSWPGLYYSIVDKMVRDSRKQKR